jgi:type II secretory pathway pseudopilin PulG
MKGWIIFAVVVAILIAIIAVLYFLGKKAEKKQAEQQEQLKAAAQNISMLIIDKKRMKLKEAGLPSIVLESTPKYLRGAKMPIVKAKVGPQIMVLLCDREIFDMIPVKKEVKAAVSGIYILEVKALHGKLPKVEAPKKKGFKKFVEKIQEKAGAKPL